MGKGLGEAGDRKTRSSFGLGEGFWAAPGASGVEGGRRGVVPKVGFTVSPSSWFLGVQTCLLLSGNIYTPHFSCKDYRPPQLLHYFEGCCFLLNRKMGLLCTLLPVGIHCSSPTHPSDVAFPQVFCPCRSLAWSIHCPLCLRALLPMFPLPRCLPWPPPADLAPYHPVSN